MVTNGFTTVSAASCWYDGRKHEYGETFPANDGCNDCVCESGEVICSKKACNGGQSSLVLDFFKNIHMQVISASVQLSVEQILEANVFSRSYFLECVTPTAPLRGQTMERHGAQPRSTIRDITSVARGIGATALPLAVALAMEEGGAPGNHGAAALPPVEEVRGVVQGAALVKAAQDRPWRLSGVTRRAAVIVVPGEHGAGAREGVEGLAVRAGADRADRETVKGRRAAPARPRDAPARVAEAALG